MNAREVIAIFYPESNACLGELLVDAFIKESHTLSAEITEHPIANGSVMADHIITKPFSLSIDGIISNTPMSLIGLTVYDSAVNVWQGQSHDKILKTFELIENLFAKRTPISIATSLKTYQNMVLEHLTLERGGGFYNDVLHFNCTAKQIEIAYQERIKIPEPKVNRAKAKEKKGLQETKPVAPETANVISKDQSFLKGILDSFSWPGRID